MTSTGSPQTKEASRTPRVTLIQEGELYAPEYRGQQSLLLVGGRIAAIGTIDPRRIQLADLPLQVIDATNRLVAPGLIDCHEHLIGAGGEQGPASRQPEVRLEEIARAGITTVVGCLGTDTVTRHLTSLLTKVRQLEQQGLSAYMYTGGFQVPPPTMTGSVLDDLVLIDKIIGVGEIAISDVRSSQPLPDELARVVSQARVGGMLAAKAGIVHFHVGPGRERLRPLHALLDGYEVEPEQLHATHINRSEALMDDAIALARRGAYVDIDTVEEDVTPWLRYYRDHGGPADRLTLSSDANTPGGSPAKLRRALVAGVRELELPLADLLPLFSSNPARALKLNHKGALAEGMDADVLVLDRESLRPIHVFATGRQLVAEGEMLMEDAAAWTPGL